MQLLAISYFLLGSVYGLPRYNETFVTEDRTGTREYYLVQSKCQQCMCGLPMQWTKIVGGEETEINEYPWMAALVRKGKFFCGGSLINDRYVLTAAHCVSRKKLVATDITVILSDHNLVDLDEAMSETHHVDAIISHPQYKATVTLDNDVALIRLAVPVNFRAGLAPICLPPPYVDFANHCGVVAGWGSMKDNGPASHVLHSVQVPILTTETCLTTEYTLKEVTPNMFCAGNLEYGGVDSCKGDSGGSLIIEDEMNRMIAAGVVSWGNGCAKPNLPGVYTRVNNYLTWIEENTYDACSCV